MNLYPQRSLKPSLSSLCFPTLETELFQGFCVFFVTCYYVRVFCPRHEEQPQCGAPGAASCSQGSASCRVSVRLDWREKQRDSDAPWWRRRPDRQHTRVPTSLLKAFVNAFCQFSNKEEVRYLSGNICFSVG